MENFEAAARKVIELFNDQIQKDGKYIEQQHEHIKMFMEMINTYSADAKRYQYLRDTKPWPKEVYDAMVLTRTEQDAILDAFIAQKEATK